jgi:prolyl-tRNA editing enzyme YbaK/EbsC (Cys-tRNA(Pro) deacylase)
VETKIKKLLDGAKVKFTLQPHRKVYTAFNAAETQKLKTSQVVKVVFLKLKKPSLHLLDNGERQTLTHVLVAVPAGKRVDLKKVAKAVTDHALKSYRQMLKANPKLKKPAAAAVSIGSERDIEKILKTKVGLLHPFGALWRLPVLVDTQLAKNPKLVVSAGSYTESCVIKTKDFLRLTPHLVGRFS